MCILRCPSFGPRISITNKIGLIDVMGRRADGAFGAFSGSCKIEKQSLSEKIRDELDRKGVVIVKLKKEQIHEEKLSLKVCQQYALKEFAENIVLLDTGCAKLMTPFMPLDQLREIEGFENARYVDPYAGGKGNSIRYLSVAQRTDGMLVRGAENVFCGGEKSGLFVGHTEAITTGSLAGYNACRYLKGIPLMELPDGLATGDLISFANAQIEKEDGLKTRYTFAGAEYFERMKKLGLYTTDRETVEKRLDKYGLRGIYNEKLIRR